MAERRAEPAIDPERVVCRWLDALNRRNLEQLLELSDETIELRPLRLAGFELVYEGLAGVRRWFEQLLQLGPEHELQIDSLRRVGTGEAVAVGSVTLGREESVVSPFTGLHHVSGGRVVLARHYLSEPELVGHIGLL